MAHAVQLAAIAALGEAGDGSYDQLSMLAADDGADTCLHMAKLNLYQCLAVARPHYEEIFCLGQHVLMDTGQCVMMAVGAAQPVVVPVAPPPSPPAASSPKHPARRHHGP